MTGRDHDRHGAPARPEPDETEVRAARLWLCGPRTEPWLPWTASKGEFGKSCSPEPKTRVQW